MLTLYGPDDEDCTTPIGTSGFTPTEPGTYRWIAAYSGDAQFEPVSTSCTPVAVRAVPGLVVGFDRRRARRRRRTPPAP